MDIENHAELQRYLVESGRVRAGQVTGCHTLAGGVSSRTVLVRLSDGSAWVLKQALPKLRVTMDWFSDPARVHREALALRWLRRLAPEGTVPEFLFEDVANHVLAMQAVAEPHENWKSQLLEERLDFEHVRQFATILGTIHSRSARLREELVPEFADRAYFETLRIEPYYRCTAALLPASAPFYAALIARTWERSQTFVHGDFSPKNVLVHADPSLGDRLVLLDHEVSHWGDPAFDAGFALTHLLSKAHHLPAARDRFVAAAGMFWEHYFDLVRDEAWSNELPEMAAHQTLGCLLARVAGRSPLEYLSDTERSRQRAVVLGLMRRPPGTVRELIGRFAEELGA